MIDQAVLESTHLTFKIPQATMDLDDKIGGSEDLVWKLCSICMVMR